MRQVMALDWSKSPQGKNESSVKVTSDASPEVVVKISAINHTLPDPDTFKGFIEANNYISIEAEHFTNKVEKDGIQWVVIPGFGRTLSGVTIFPTTLPPVDLGNDNPRLEYSVYLYNPGKIKARVFIAPSLNIYNDEGMRYAVSFDNGEPQIYKIHEFDTVPDWKYPAYWNNSVTDNIRILTTELNVEKAGEHTFKLWMVTPGVVVEKIVLETGEIGNSYLGPPESYFSK